METVKTEKVKEKHSPLSFRHFVLGAIAIGVYVGIEIGIPSTANLFMTNPTIEQAEAKVNLYNKQQSAAINSTDIIESDIEGAEIDRYTDNIVDEDSFVKAQRVINKEIAPGLGLDAGIAGILVGIYWLLDRKSVV